MFSLIKRRLAGKDPRIVVHVGMHKTGTTSIQDTFYHSTDPAIEYIDWVRSNHSDLFVMLFEDPAKYGQYHGFKARGAGYIAQLPELCERWQARVTEQIRKANGKTVILSAEDCSAPAFDAAVERMHQYFTTLSPDVSAIGYARNPRDFIESAFQQNLRGGVVVNLERKGLRPNYQRRFEKIDRHFGADRVTLKEFHPDHLIGGNVVKDFAATVGIPTPPDHTIAHANSRMSLETTALLYVQRRFGQGLVSGFPQAERANNLFIEKLSSIGHSSLTLAPETMAPLLDQIADDVVWMENRLGRPFTQTSDTSADTITKMDDLTDIAIAHYDDVVALSDQAQPGPTSLENLVNVLEQVRERVYADCMEASADA